MTRVIRYGRLRLIEYERWRQLRAPPYIINIMSIYLLDMMRQLPYAHKRSELARAAIPWWYGTSFGTMRRNNYVAHEIDFRSAVAAAIVGIVPKQELQLR